MKREDLGTGTDIVKPDKFVTLYTQINSAHRELSAAPRGRLNMPPSAAAS